MDEEKYHKILKKTDIKEGLAFEKSIELCKRLTVDQLMFNDYTYLLESYHNFNISKEDIRITIDKVFKNPTIQILWAEEGVE